MTRNHSIVEQEWVIGPCSNRSDVKLESINDSDYSSVSCLTQSLNTTYCTIISKRFGKCLDIAGGTAFPGSHIGMYDCHEQGNQQFMFGKQQVKNNVEPNQMNKSDGKVKKRRVSQCMIQPAITYEHRTPPLCLDMNEEFAKISLCHCNGSPFQYLQAVPILNNKK